MMRRSVWFAVAMTAAGPRRRRPRRARLDRATIAGGAARPRAAALTAASWNRPRVGSRMDALPSIGALGAGLLGPHPSPALRGARDHVAAARGRAVQHASCSRGMRRLSIARHRPPRHRLSQDAVRVLLRADGAGEARRAGEAADPSGAGTCLCRRPAIAAHARCPEHAMSREQLAQTRRSPRSLGTRLLCR